MAFEAIECSLFFCPDDDWEIYVNYNDAMYGVSYISAEQAVAQREQMKWEIEEEFAKHQFEPSGDFINTFARKYRLNVFAFSD